MNLTKAEFHVLLVLVEGPCHGYKIMQDVEAITRGELRLGPGTLYTAIKRLLTSGTIEECATDVERRRCYRLTRKGKTLVIQDLRRMSHLVGVARKRGLVISPA